MEKWCLHASSFIFDQIVIKVAGNQDRHKSLVDFDFGPNQTTHLGVTCPWETKISHFWTWKSLIPVGQSCSNFMCSVIRGGEKLHKVLGQIGLKLWFPWQQKTPINLQWGNDVSTFSQFFLIRPLWKDHIWHWTRVTNCCPLGYLFTYKDLLQAFFFSSHEPKAHWWAYRIGRPLSIVLCCGWYFHAPVGLLKNYTS